MNEQNKNLKTLRQTIILIGIVGLLSSLSITLTTFAYGVGENSILILLLFPTLIISTILEIVNIKFGYFLALLTAIIYACVLTSEVGFFLVFNLSNSVLLLILLLPYIVFLSLIPLITIYLSQSKKLKISSIVLVFSFLIFAIAERQNKSYFENIFIDAEIGEQGQIKLNCKPGFGDSRTFVINTKSKELEQQIKKYGKYNQGSYFIQNTEIEKKFNFTNLKSITFKKFGDNKLKNELTWEKAELNGDTDFLQP